MKKMIFLFMLSLLIVSMAWGQGSETFTNLGANASNYANRSWTGDDGVTWTAQGARTDQTLTGKAICFGTAGTRNVKSPSYSGGMGTLTFNYVKGFTTTGNRTLEVFVNSTKIGSDITVSKTSSIPVQYSADINVTGNVILEIRSTGASQVIVDDIVWTAYGASTPSILVTPSTLSGFIYTFGEGPSAQQSFTVSGENLTDDIIITAPANYEISTATGGSFATTNPITLSPSEGVVSATNIYVRLKDNLDIGTYNEEIAVSSTDASDRTVTCSGEVTAPPAPDAPIATEATAIDDASFTATWEAVPGVTGYYLDVYTKTEGANATDLFISEYIEGNGYNKVIEIYNGTGVTVDISAYNLKVYVNGSTSPGSPINLSGNIANGATYVVVNPQAGSTFLDKANQTSGSLSHNGDDGVGLFNGTTLVDMVGTLGDTTNWGKDVTLVRQSTATVPTATYIASDWDSYGIDTITYLGAHTFSGGSSNTFVAEYNNLNVGNVLSYIVTGLNPETTYYYVVRAYQDYQTHMELSEDSNESAVTTTNDATLPVELSTFNVNLNSENAAVLTWVTQTETGVSGFHVYRHTEDLLANAELISDLIPATNTSQEHKYNFSDTELNGFGTYYYWLQVADLDGSDRYHGPITLLYQDGNEQDTPEIQVVTELKRVFPNPFNPNTTISYYLDKAVTVNVNIYNSRGQLVRSFAEGLKAEGNYNLSWNGEDNSGRSLPTGVYYIRMQAGHKSFNKKAVLMK